MPWRRVTPVAVLAVAAAVAAAGCSEAEAGSAHRAQPATPDANRSYGYAEDRCGLLADASVQQLMGADHIVRPYSACSVYVAKGADVITWSIQTLTPAMLPDLCAITGQLAQLSQQRVN